MLLMGKSTISMAMFNGFLYVYRRVSIWMRVHCAMISPYEKHPSKQAKKKNDRVIQELAPRNKGPARGKTGSVKSTQV